MREIEILKRVLIKLDRMEESARSHVRKNRIARLAARVEQAMQNEELWEALRRYEIEYQSWLETREWEKATGAPVGLFSGPKPKPS